MAKRTVLIKIEIELENSAPMNEADYMEHEVKEVFNEVIPISRRVFSKYQNQTGDTIMGNKYEITITKEDLNPNHP
jgi:hypothetical protein